MKTFSAKMPGGLFLIAVSAQLAQAAPAEKTIYAKSCDEIIQAMEAHDESHSLLIKIDQPKMICSAPLLMNKNNLHLEGVIQPNGKKPLVKLAENLSIPLIVIGSEKTVKRELKLSELESESNPLSQKVREHLAIRLNAEGSVLTTPRRVENVSVKNLELDGSLNFERMHNGTDHECWGSKQCDDHNDERSHVRNNAITIRGAQDVLVDNVDTYSTRSGGIVTEKYCVRLTLKNIKSTTNYFDGFAGYETYDSVIENANFVKNHHAGVSLDIDFSFNQFVKSSFSDNGHSGVFARWAKGNIFSEVVIDRNGTGDHAPGVFLAQNNPTNDDTCVSDTLFIRSKFSQNVKGYRVNDAACKGNQIIDSQFSENTFGNISVAKGAVLKVKDKDANPGVVVEAGLLGSHVIINLAEISTDAGVECHLGLGNEAQPLAPLNGAEIKIHDVGTDWTKKDGFRTVKMWVESSTGYNNWVECSSRGAWKTNKGTPSQVWKQFAGQLEKGGLKVGNERMDQAGKILLSR